MNKIKIPSPADLTKDLLSVQPLDILLFKNVYDSLVNLESSQIKLNLKLKDNDL